MKRASIGRTLLFTLAAGISTTVLATGGMSGKSCDMQGVGMHKMGGMHQGSGEGAMQEMRQARMGAMLQEIKESLALNPDQESAWQAFEERVKQQIGSGAPGRPRRPGTTIRCRPVSPAPRRNWSG